MKIYKREQAGLIVEAMRSYRRANDYFGLDSADEAIIADIWQTIISEWPDLKTGYPDDPLDWIVETRHRIARQKSGKHMISDEQLAEWERLSATATAGPWVPSLSVMDGLPHFQILGGHRNPSGYGFAIVHGTIEDGDIIPESSDLDFIAAARTAVPALIAEVRRLHGERESCAQLAESIGASAKTGPGGDCTQGCQGIADEIAAAIRGRQ